MRIDQKQRLLRTRKLVGLMVALVLVAAPAATAAPPSGQIDLQLSLTDRPDPVTAGEQLTYDLVVTNRGTVNATEVYLSFYGNPDVVSVTTSQGSCDSGAYTWCRLGSVPKRASASVAIVVRADAEYARAQAATWSDAEQDRNADDNSAETTTTVIGPASGPLSECSAPDAVNASYKRTCTGNFFVLDQAASVRLELRPGPTFTGHLSAGLLSDNANCPGTIERSYLAGRPGVTGVTATGNPSVLLTCPPGTYRLFASASPTHTPEVGPQWLCVPTIGCRALYVGPRDVGSGSFGAIVTMEEG
jgi:hypothetical protein